MEKDAFRRSLCTVVYVTCHVRGCCNLHLTSPTRHLYVVCTYLVLGTYSSSVRGRGLNQYWWPPKDHHSLLVLLRRTKFTFKSRKTLFAILLCIRQNVCSQIVYYWIMHRKLIERSFITIVIAQAHVENVNCF